jgi:hypothetical protein
MKVGWGTGISLVIAVFVAACIAFLIFANTQDNSLVENDYYARGIRYEEMLVKMRNAASLPAQPGILNEQGSILVVFPETFRKEKLAGSVYVYRPSDRRLDLVLPLKLDTALSQRVDHNRLKKGRYTVKLDWSMRGKTYFVEKEIFIE